MARQSRLLRILLAGLLILAACDGCGGCGDDEEGKDAGKEGQDAAAIPEFDAGSIHTVELTPEVLLPVIQAIGFPNVVPSRVTVQFARNLIDGGARAVADDITLFDITPDIPGQLRFASNSTLEFKPEGNFKPGEEYQVTLSQVESRNGPMIPPTPWTHSFKVPEFKFVELSGAYLSEAAKQVQVEMRFSAPIDPKRLPEFAIWKYNGQRVRSVQYSRGNESFVARVFLKSPLFERGGTLTVDVEEGFPYDEEITAPGGNASVELETGKPVTLLEALRREGPDGYYIEVVCNDESAPGGTRYYYDRRTYDSWRVSRRCLPLDDAKKLISFNPPVDFRIASGEGGFNILGNFKRGNYAMNIESGLRTIDGGVVKSPFTSEVTIPSRSPSIEFVNKGRYVPKSQWRKLPIRHLNVDEVEVSVRHVPERNAIFWMSNATEEADHRTSVLIAKERVKFSSKSDEFNTSFIDVKKLVGDPEPGLYEVMVEGLGQRDSVRLVPTNINLVMKRSSTRPGEKWADSALVWAIDMKTLKPVSGVKVDVVRPSGDVMTTCDTDATGGCRVSIPTDTVDETPPFAGPRRPRAEPRRSLRIRQSGPRGSQRRRWWPGPRRWRESTGGGARPGCRACRCDLPTATPALDLRALHRDGRRLVGQGARQRDGPGRHHARPKPSADRLRDRCGRTPSPSRGRRRCATGSARYARARTPRALSRTGPGAHPSHVSLHGGDLRLRRHARRLELLVVLAIGPGAGPSTTEPPPATEDVLGDVVVDASQPGREGPRLIRVTLAPPSSQSPDLLRVHEVVHRDLDLSGQFVFVDERPEARIELGVTRAESGATRLQAAVFFDPNADLPAYRVEVAGHKPALRRLTHRLVDDVIERLTGTPGPFHSRLSMVLRRGDTRSLYTMDPDGFGLRRVTGAHLLVGDASLGPEDALYYSASERHSRYRIYREGTDTPLAIELPGSVYGLAFSADRSRVALTAGVGSDVRLFAGPSDFSGLESVGDLALTLSPAFAPDGRIAIAGTDRARPRIHVGGRAVSRRGSSASSPSFCDHPDGVRLVYARGDRKNTAIVVADLRGRTERRIVTGGGRHSAPACSPDGRLVAFFSTRKRGEGPGLYVVRVDGHHLRKVADVTGESLRWSRLSITDEGAQ